MSTQPFKPAGSGHGYKSWSQRKKILVWTGGTFAALMVTGGIANAVSPPKPAPVSHAAPAAAQAPKAAPKPAVTVTHTVTAAPKPAPTVTHTATPAPSATPAAPPADQIIARFSGTGSGNTGTFTVPADGDWHLSWSFTNGSLFAGQDENFQVYEYDATTGQLVNVLVNAMAAGNGQPTADPVYDQGEAGQSVYFQVNTEDASWNLVPVTGTN